MSDQAAVVTEVRGRVLLITLNRPDQMNAVNTDLAQGLVADLEVATQLHDPHAPTESC